MSVRISAAPETRTPPKIAVTIHPMAQEDIPRVEVIERESFEVPWTPEEFHNCIPPSQFTGYVARDSTDQILGFFVYQIFQEHVRIENFAVIEWARAHGIGSQMLHEIANIAKRNRLKGFFMIVREKNINGLKFFRAEGLKARAILTDLYQEYTTEQSYLMYRSVRVRQN